jgi:ABC-2 type transport system permease protein
MIFTIAGRELRSLFLSPLAWTILGVLQIIYALIFSSSLERYIVEIQPQLFRFPTVGVTEIVVTPVYNFIAIVLLFTIPLLTMRTISEEKRSKSIALLFSAPLSMTDIILGKYFGVVAFLVIMLAINTLMPLSLLYFGTLDFGLLAASLLGVIMFLAAVTAIGIFMSSLTSQPIIAAILGIGTNLLLWILNFVGTNADPQALNPFAYVSLFGHLQSFGSGVFNTSDFFYYLIVIIIFLVLSIRRLDGDRLQR